MKILVLSTWFPYPPDNGSKLRAYHLLRAFQDSHQVTLVSFCPDARGDRPGSFPELEGLPVHCVAADPYRYVDLPKPLTFLSPIPLAWWPSREMRRAVGRVARSKEWDVVVAIQAPAAIYALQLPAVPRVLDVDVALSYQLQARYLAQTTPVARSRTWVSWKKAHRYETWLLRRFQACTIVSRVEVGHLQTLLADSGCRVKVIPNGVDCQHKRPGLVQPQPNALVFNGALTYSANYDAMRYFLSEIYPHLCREVPDVSLTITGSLQGVDLSGLPLDGSVHLSGYVDDVRPLVAGASVCVVPVRQGGGTRLKILEAMALGTPVVTTSKGAEGLEVTPEENILIADDPAGFAAQVVRLLRDPALRQRLSRNARRLVEGGYDWQAIGRQFTELVETVAGERARP